MMSLPTVVFITALPCEFNAVTSHLTDRKKDIHPKDTIYEVGEYQAKSVKWRVAVAEIGQTNSRAAQETERAIQHFNPAFAFFVGVAGGVKDVKFGDVVAADVVKGYERGKMTDTGFLPRPDVYKSSYDLVQRARATARSENKEWLSKIKRENDKEPDALVATIATGEQVIASKKTETFNLLQNTYSDVVAVEMEGIGFLTAIEADKAVSGIVIRGISDLLQKKTSKNDKKWQPIAAENAAAFAFAMLDELKPDDPVKSPSSLIFKLDQDDRNLDAYRLQAWFNNTMIHASENYRRKNLPSVIDNILHEKVFGKYAICRDEFTIEFFLPQKLLFEPIDQWVLDADVGETLGNCHKLVIRSSERFDFDNKPFNRLNHYWKKNSDLLQRTPKHVLYDVQQNEVVEIQSRLEDGKLLFILKFMSDQDFLFKLIRYGVPFLLWTRKNSTCDEEIKEFDNLLSCCATLEQLPEKLRKERLRIVERKLDQSSMMFNLSLLWDDPNKIPPFSKLSPPTKP